MYLESPSDPKKQWVNDPVILGDQPFFKGQKETPGTSKIAIPNKSWLENSMDQKATATLQELSRNRPFTRMWSRPLRVVSKPFGFKPRGPNAAPVPTASAPWPEPSEP